MSLTESTVPGCVFSRCVCVCVFTAVCVCTLDVLNAEHKFRVCHVTFTFSSTIPVAAADLLKRGS